MPTNKISIELRMCMESQQSEQLKDLHYMRRKSVNSVRLHDVYVFQSLCVCAHVKELIPTCFHRKAAGVDTHTHFNSVICVGAL